MTDGRRLLALTAFCDRRLGDAFLVRAASTYGSGIAVSYALAVALDPSRAGLLLDRAFTTFAWVPGAVIALVAARDAGGSADASGVAQLARQRGFDAEELGRARLLGAALRIARVVGVRAVLLALFAASRAPEAPLVEARWVLGAAALAVVLGAVLAPLARLAARLLPERGRVLLLTGVALASALGVVWPPAPGLGDFFGALAPGLLGLGGT